MKKSILIECVRIAKAKLSYHPQWIHFLHYSFVIQNNAVVEWGTNKAGIPPIHFGYHDRLNNEGVPKLHSELVAWRKAKGLIGVKPWEMVNIRLSRKGVMRMAKPCSCCNEVMKELGCVKFYYSSEQGFLCLI